MLKRTMAVTRGVVLLGIALALRQFGFVLPVSAQDICHDPLLCFNSCKYSSLGEWECFLSLGDCVRPRQKTFE